MSEFKPGQRWICDADLQLGIGTIQSVEGRTINISFMAAGETRTYAMQSAPLTRVIFSAGDTATNHEGRTLIVESVNEYNGLLTYVGTDEDGNQQQFEEQQLADFAQFYRPTERLFNGHIDKNKWFQVRYQTLQHQQHLTNTTIHGLTGCRTSLIPHQLYIAHEVANRYAPRVLLADEVGLGKTIEAGLILHHQLLTERANRVLIIVPETLVHQWLVEMLRRFNLHFSVFDEERCDVIEENNDQENPFHSEQLVLCSLDFLKHDPKRFQAALAGEWDLLIVDEAHHLAWSEEEASPEYTLIEQLAKHTKGVLLLTATPEQLGKASHFARLRLLDSDRFSDFETFVAEEQSFEPIAKAVEALLDTQPIDDATMQLLISAIHDDEVQQQLDDLLNTPIDSDKNKRAREILIARLLDQHGTGRVLFRNTRATIKGFPGRKAWVVPLPLPAQYDDALEVFETNFISETQLLLCPELLYQDDENLENPHWTEIDPRIDWLLEILLKLSPEKVLVITASTQTALDIAQAIKTITGQHIPVFHEHMNLIARDRAAAFFADNESGCQLLVCSEIGSEGRNFQFAHHLVLFDLPLNPDLLEQRIGRLDRIGQTETINIHIPYLENSAQAVMLHWYQQGLNAFEHTCAAGQTVFLQVASELNAALHHRATSDDLLKLINTTQSSNQTLNAALHQGRDKLLEYNSFRPAIANQLKQQALEQDADLSLLRYMDRIFDCFGVHTEEHRNNSYILRPSEHMTTAFHGLSDEGMTITYHRDIALTNEDIHYLTWAHPMVVNAMDRVSSSEFGNTAVSAIQCEQIEPGTLLLESLFVLEAPGEHIQQNKRYLPSTIIRILIDEHGRNNYQEFDHETLNGYQVRVSAVISRQVIQLKKESIKTMVSRSESLAQMETPNIVSHARNHIKEMFTQEIERLQALHKVNPNVRLEEIEFFQQQLEGLLHAIDSTHLRLDALRVIVAT